MTFDQLESVRTRLRQFYDDGDVDIWLQAPQKLLDGRVAVDCSFEEVDRLIAQLEDGVYI